MSNIERKPKIRFPEFTDAWEQCKFGDILKIYSFKSFFNGICDDGRFEVIQQGDTPILGYGNGNPFEDYKDVVLFGDHTLSLYKPNSPFFVATDGIKILGSNCNLDRNFLFTVLERYKPMSEGYKRHFTILKNSDLCFCKNIDEQKKIGEYFCNLDNLITLHQRKLEILKKLKKGFLQKLFPQKDNKVPELRFPGFSGDWELRKLGEICKIVMGQSPDSATYSDNQSDYILVQGNADLKDGWVKPRIWTSQKTKMAKAGDLIMSVRAPAGAMGKTSYDAVIGRGVAAITANEFIFQDLVKKDLTGYWKKLSCGSTFESLNSKDIFAAEINIPSNEEQNKIGLFFKSLDSNITLHQRKLEILQNIKKGFLQQMFV